MGMYTEIFVKVEFKPESPELFIDCLKWLAGVGEKPKALPEHRLFSLPRFEQVLTCSSYYHQPRATTQMWFDDIAGQWYLCSRSDLKNYDGEIAAFFDWIKPHVDCNPGAFIGYSLYEEDDSPTLVFAEQ